LKIAFYFGLGEKFLAFEQVDNKVWTVYRAATLPHREAITGKQKEAKADVTINCIIMPNNKKNGQVKMSLGDFMGGPPTAGLNALPTRPKERG
jgi:hypothetical protein